MSTDTLVERLRQKAQFWKAEGQYGDVASAVGDEVTAEYAMSANDAAAALTEAADRLESYALLVERMREALRIADKALREHACHGGPGVPCLRAAYACRLDCGRLAGDALIVVREALSSSVGG